MDMSNRKLSCVSWFKYLVYCAAVMFALGTINLSAQEGGTIVGTVSDSTGAVIANAQVTALNQGTGAVVRTTATNTSGNYIFAGLPVSTYTLRV